MKVLQLGWMKHYGYYNYVIMYRYKLKHLSAKKVENVLVSDMPIANIQKLTVGLRARYLYRVLYY